MTIKTFTLFDAINREGLDNSQWNIHIHMNAVSTKDFYGTDEDVILEGGIWVSVYEEIDEPFMFSKSHSKPDYRLRLGDCYLLLYNVSD